MPVQLSSYLKNTAAWAPFVIRLVLGFIFIVHGSQKLFGWFGGPGIGGTAQSMNQLGMHPGILWAWIVIIAEFFGGLALVFGFLTGLAALGILIDMLVAVILIHGKNGFFLNTGGFEYNLALIAMALSLILSGPGALSIDRLIHWKF